MIAAVVETFAPPSKEVPLATQKRSAVRLMVQAAEAMTVSTTTTPPSQSRPGVQ